MTKREADAGRPHPDHGSRMGWDRGVEHAVAALVAVDLLRDHRVGLRLLDLLSGVADDQRLHQRRARLLPVAPRCRRSRRPAEGARRQGRGAPQVSLADIEKDPALLAFAQAQGKAAFGNNCAPCHGVGATGAKGYPNLNDDDWLWGGTLDEIRQTIAYGVRSGDAKAHESAMPAFGKDGHAQARRDRDGRELRALAVRAFRASGVDLAAGKKIFADNCAACHGADGKGNRELGAPNLTDRIWLYGSDEATSSRPSPTAARRDAGMGRPARSRDDQCAHGLRAHARRGQVRQSRSPEQYGWATAHFAPCPAVRSRGHARFATLRRSTQRNGARDCDASKRSRSALASLEAGSRCGPYGAEA